MGRAYQAICRTLCMRETDPFGRTRVGGDNSETDMTSARLSSIYAAFVAALSFSGCAKAPNEPVASPAPRTTSAPACAEDAKECPDGSFVSREGPSCTFAACPASPERAARRTSPRTRKSPPRTRKTPPKRVACTKDAKICPDGTTVGRQGPDCEFAACPGE